MEKYSILMSVYYKEKAEWFKESIKSMLNQTIPPNEFVIVKDGPLTNELDNVIEKYVQEYPNLFVIVALKKNVGLGIALSIGITKCSNELIARMDSDDISAVNRCEEQLKIFEENSNYDIIGCFENEFVKSVNEIVSVHKVPMLPEDIKKFMRRRCALLHPTVMYKKSAVLKAGNYKDCYLCEDYDLFIRMVLENDCKAFNIQDGLFFMRVNEQFYFRRGGLKYLKMLVSFKFRQFKRGNMSLIDFIVSAGSHCIVCLLPNKLRHWVYVKLLRK